VCTIVLSFRAQVREGGYCSLPLPEPAVCAEVVVRPVEPSAPRYCLQAKEANHIYSCCTEDDFFDLDVAEFS